MLPSFASASVLPEREDDAGTESRVLVAGLHRISVTVRSNHRDGGEREENKVGMEKEQTQARNGASEALARFPAVPWPHHHTWGTQCAHSSVETARYVHR